MYYHSSTCIQVHTEVESILGQHAQLFPTGRAEEGDCSVHHRIPGTSRHHCVFCSHLTGCCIQIVQVLRPSPCSLSSTGSPSVRYRPLPGIASSQLLSERDCVHSYLQSCGILCCLLCLAKAAIQFLGYPSSFLFCCFLQEPSAS